MKYICDPVKETIKKFVEDSSSAREKYINKVCNKFYGNDPELKKKCYFLEDPLNQTISLMYNKEEVIRFYVKTSYKNSALQCDISCETWPQHADIKKRIAACQKQTKGETK